MSDDLRLPCRIAACRDREDSASWSFFLINDSDVPFDAVELLEVVYNWGDYGNAESPNRRVAGPGPGAHVQVWDDDGSGAELQMDLVFRVFAAGRDARKRFELPRLYRLRDLPLVDGLGRAGWSERGVVVLKNPG